WLHENQHTPEKLKIKLLREEKRVLGTFSDAAVKKIVLFKPRTFTELRLHTLLCTLVDTGIRIEEALTLKRSGFDADNLLLTVRGKGNKERLVPISFELRKILWKFLQRHNFDLVFCNTHGTKLLYDNIRRD